MQRTSFILASLFLLLAGCAGKTLDGGSTGDTSGAGTGQGADPSKETDGEMADTPVAGQIAGKPFAPKTIDVTFSKRNNQWFLSFANYENECGTGNVPDPAEAMAVNVGGLEPAAGTFTIKYADGHGASLQLGIYDSSEKSDTRTVQSGTLRFDNWDETPGATITGGIKLFADDESSIVGTFSAKVCAAR